MNKQQRKEKFMQDNPGHRIIKAPYYRKYPFLSASEAIMVGHAKHKGLDWLKLNHIEVFNKLLDNNVIIYE